MLRTAVAVCSDPQTTHIAEPILRMSEALPFHSGLPFRQADFETLGGALDYAAGGATGLTFYAGNGKLTEVLPYRDLREQALVLARKLLACGLEPGDRVALIAETDGAFARLFFACQYAGLVPAPMPLLATFGGRAPYVDHIRRMVKAAHANAAFAPSALGALLAEAVGGLDLKISGTVEDLEALPEAKVDLSPNSGNALAYLQFSSGSTRFPMGVAVTQKALMSNLSAIARDGLRIGPEDRGLSWLPFYHDMGLVGFLLAPMATQISVDLLPTRDFARRPLLWPTLISANRATLSFSPTFGYDLAARRAETVTVPADLDLSCWRAAGVGGDMVRPQVLERFADAYAGSGFARNTFLPCYGMAEATLAISFTALGAGAVVDRLDVDRMERDEIAAKPSGPNARSREFVRCGQPLPGHQIAVRDRHGNPLHERRIGRIYVRGPSLMREYYRQPQASRTVISPDGWLDTGDLGYLTGGEVVVTGRAKDLILVNGRNIAPQDLEWTVEHEVPGVRSGDAAAFALDDGGGETVVVLVQCRQHDAGARDALCEAVQGVVRQVHGVDCRVVLIPHNSLPYSSSGKLSRSRARHLYLDDAFRGPVPASAA